MNNKLLAVLAVVAVAFAAVAVVTEIDDVDAEAKAITVDGSITNGTVTASAASAEAAASITITVTPSDDYVLKDGSLKVYETGNPSNMIAYTGSGPYTFTMKDFAVTITAKFLPEDYDYQPTAFAYGYTNDDATGVYKGMKVLAYADKAILIDTNAMDLNPSDNTFYVGINPTPGTADAELKIGPVVSQNGWIWIDGAGNNIEETPKALLTSGQNSMITLYSYAAVSPLAYASLAYTATEAQMELLTNHNDDWSKVNYDSTTGAYAAFGTFETLRTTNEIVMDSDANINIPGTKNVFDGKDAGYALKGWSLTEVADSKIVIQPTELMTIEEIVFAMADHIAANDADLMTLDNPIQSNKATLYAIWEEVLFTLEVGDITLTDPTEGTPDAEGTPYTFTAFTFNINDVFIGGAGTEVSHLGIASVTSKVSANSFALLRMQQSTPNQYKYQIDVYRGITNGETGVKTWYTVGTWQKAADVEEIAKYLKIDMINNGLYKISNVKADLRFVITMTALTPGTDYPDTNAYAFQIDQIRNADSHGDDGPGFVNLSLDLFDYVAKKQTNAGGDDDTNVINSQIAIEGTYFKTLGADDSAQRVYGDLKNLAGITPTAYVDLKVDSDKIVNYQVDAKHAVEDKALELTPENSVFDLSYQLGANTFIYSAKGVWNTVEEEYEGGEATDADPTVNAVQETSWALYKA